MKSKLLKAAIFILFVCSNAFGQSKAEVLNYAKQFEVNKSEYIGKPLSYLLSKLNPQTQPKKVWFNLNIKNKNLTPSSIFSLNKKEDNYGNAVRLSITWETPIPFSEVDYYYKKNKTYYTSEEKAFYEHRIIKDILVY